jgi:hypothetical protein
MKLSDTTLNIFKNFSTINPGIVVRAGKQIRTISINKAIFADATVTEEFPKEFGVYDLSKMLGVLSLHDNPEIDFQDQNLVLSGVGGRARTRLRYTDTKLILSPTKEIPIKEWEVKFTLSKEDLVWIEKVGAVLKCPNIVIENNEGQLTVSAADVKGEVVDDSNLDLGKVENTTPFKFTIKVENLKLLEGNYVVELSTKGVAKFSNQNVTVTYWVATEKAHSFYGKKTEAA